MFSKASKIYAIVDQETCLENDVDTIEFAKILHESGIEILQYRNKLDNMLVAMETFEEIIEATNNEMIYIINDHEKIAIKHADNKQVFLHAGQTDRVQNPETRFGRSTHNMAEVELALKEIPKPAYLAFGAMFPGTTRPEVAPNQAQLSQVMEAWKHDLVLIGGITLENISTLPKSEHIYYALISDFFAEGNEPVQIEKRAKMLLAL